MLNFGAIVDISTPDKSRPVYSYGTVDIKLSCVSIDGYGNLIRGHEGVNITASMVSLLSWPTSEGSQYAVIQHGNPQVGKPGGVSITGSVVSIVGRDTETAGILTRRGLLITESCLAIVSDGPCISVSHLQDGGMQYFNHVRLFAVSQNGNAFADGLGGDTNYAYWGDGKYVLCAASEEKAAMVAKTVEIDEGVIELCSPQNYGAVAHAFLMKDGSFKMAGKLNKKLLREEILAESAVEGILTASLGWTSVQSEILLNMLANLDAALTTDVSGAAVSAVLSQEFVQTGGRMEQGDSACGHLAVDKYMARTKNGKTPAFTGGVFDGSFLMDYDETDPHPLVNAPTNALGQVLTRVDYEPYWVYKESGDTPVRCKVVFNANKGKCSTTSRQVAKGAGIGTLPTATRNGYVFDGWYTSASGGTKVTAMTKVTGNVTYYAHWKGNAHYKLTVKPNSTKYGAVSGGGNYVPGKTVTLKATAKPGYVFAGWYTDAKCKISLSVQGCDNRKASVKYAMPARDKNVYAKFITKAADRSALWFMPMTWSLALTPAKLTAGSVQTLWFGFMSASLPTVTATGLPPGMSIDKRMGVVSGKPMKPGKYVAKVTVKTAAGNKITQKVRIDVKAPVGFYGTFDGYALVGTTPAYVTFTSDAYGKVSGKVTYKGKGYKFTSSYAASTATASKFTPAIKIGTKTYRPVTYVKLPSIGTTVVSQANGAASGFVWVAQKGPGFVKKGKALSELVGRAFSFKSGYAGAWLTGSKDVLKVKFVEWDAVLVTGTARGKKVSFSAPVLYCRKVSKDGNQLYTIQMPLVEPTAKYYRLLTFKVTVDPNGHVVSVGPTFDKIK